MLAVHRHRTMSAAALCLDTNVATVSRRIDRLGLDLGLPLFEKRGTGLVPTAAAVRLLAIAEDLDHRLRAEMSNPRPGSAGHCVPIEIAAPPAVHRHFLLPRTGDLARVLPHVMLTMSDKVFAEGLGEADIQIRIGRPEGGRLRARKFRDYRCASITGSVTR